MHLPQTPARKGVGTFYATVLLLLICGGAASPARGDTTFVVTNNSDPGEGICTAAGIGDGCTLREAIDAANAAAGADTVDATGVTGEIELETALPDLSSDITIVGPGAELLKVRRDPNALSFRIFTIASGVMANLSGLTITDGRTANGSVSPSLSGGNGGGILNNGTLTIDRCTISGNKTGNGHNAAGTYAPGGSGGSGGGIYNVGTLTLIDSIVSGNKTGNGGTGGLGGGGGFPGGTGGSGAGIFNEGTATVVNTTVSGNQTGNGATGGGFSSQSATGSGGGITSFGTLTLSACTIHGNSAGSSGSNANGVGGGGGISGSGQLTISNCTISGNHSENNGGGIYAGGQMTIRNSTITANGCTYDGGGIYRDGGSFGGTVILGSTIVAGNFATIFQTRDIFGTVQSDGYNLIQDLNGANLTPNAGAGPDFEGPANLGPLADNGGPTLTHLPGSDSPAIDNGKNFSASSTDQRGLGFARVVDLPDTAYPNAADGTDIGAVEVAATPVLARNISTRARIDTGDNAIIGGFIIKGSAEKTVIIRGLGPSLQDMALAGFVADPVLELRGSDGSLIVGNDNWEDDSAQAAQLQASGLAPTRSQESAIVRTLVPGTYTAIVRGKDNTSGIGLVELYDVDNAQSQMANLSTRSFVQLQENVMIGGFTLGEGTNDTRIALRGIGPSLAQSGLNPVLADPTLELRNANGVLLIANDNWNDDGTSAALLSANGLAPTHPNESGIFTSLPAGQFTAILAGKNGGVGIGLIEVYHLK